jgi:hypothetical protein
MSVPQPKEKVFEIKVVNVATMPIHTQVQINKEVAAMPPEAQKNWKGFVKVTYITASPPSISKIEPYMGTVIDYYRKEMGGADFSIC